jgi:hypothetical protein
MLGLGKSSNKMSGSVTWPYSDSIALYIRHMRRRHPQDGDLTWVTKRILNR